MRSITVNPSQDPFWHVHASQNPEQIEKFLAIVSKYVAIVKPQYEREYHVRKDENHPPTFEKFWKDVLPEIIARTWIGLIQTTIDSKSVGNYFSTGVFLICRDRTPSLLETVQSS